MPVARSAEVAVRFEEPAYRRLAQRAVEALLPGAGALPLNGVALVEANPDFVAAFSWGHFDVDEAALARLSHVPARPAWHATPVEGAVWGRSAADIARLTWQRPVRVLIHADTLVA